MAINDVIRQKRKILGFTQENLAEQLGVSVPAVSKWETGSSYPDVTILPALARALKMDLNTLLCFQQELSQQEVGVFLNHISETAMSGHTEQAFEEAMEKVREFPNDYQLIQSLAMALQGVILMSTPDSEQKEKYNKVIQELYEMVGNGDNKEYAARANYMLASDAINKEDFERGQELIDRLPEYNDIDKRMLQAKLWMDTGKTKEAAEAYEYKVLSSISEMQIFLTNLIRIAVEEGDTNHAQELVNCGKTMTQLFGFWDYTQYIYELEKATAERDADAVMQILEPMIQALLKPWDMSESIVLHHIQQKAQNYNMGEKMLPSMLRDLEENPGYAFLKEKEEFRTWMKKYKGNE